MSSMREPQPPSNVGVLNTLLHMLAHSGSVLFAGSNGKEEHYMALERNALKRWSQDGRD